ncbi:MAG: phenylacetic acid degradation protein PaaY [Sphingomonadales bacterium]|nr:phenylacetic acid degradation protein PaaY [Sphingomonadales bacterium]
MPIYAFKEFRPVIDESAFVHPTAVVIGDVFVGPHCYVGPGASLRGDFGRIILKRGSNVQDNCVMHSFPGRAAIIDVDGHVGHGAILHGCHIGRNALVGMNAVLMDDVVIGDECFVGAMSFLKARTRTEPRSVWVGNPGRKLRDVTDEELKWKSQGTAEYQKLAEDCLATMRICDPLSDTKLERPMIGGAYRPLVATRDASSS